MSVRVRFAEAARRELNDSALWLELQEAGLGERFLLEVAQARRMILDYPFAWHPMGASLRRCHLKRFRYGLIYRIKGEVIEIVAVAHDRQNPEYWRDRKN
jgi:plasmid stabilization system protein ParE